MAHEPYLDKPQTARLWAKIKSQLTDPLGSRVTVLEGKTVDTTEFEALQAQVDLLQLRYHTEVNGITFSVDFYDLNGVIITGVWNEAEGRIEF